MSALPFSNENEQGLLGSVLQDAAMVVPEVFYEYPQPKLLFHDFRHAEIFTGASALVDDGVSVDCNTLNTWLKSNSKNAHSIGDLLDLEDKSPSPRNWPYFAKPLFELYQRRALIAATADASRIAYDIDENMPEGIDGLSQELMDLGIAAQAPTDLRGYLKEALEMWEESARHQGKLPGVSTGFFRLDRITRGFKNGQLIVIAARPGMGKTALVMSIVQHQLLDMGNHVGMFTLEMSSGELTQRMVCSVANVPMNLADLGQLTAGQWDAIKAARDKIDGVRHLFHLDDRCKLTVGQLRSKARQMVIHHGVKLIVVDYLQLIAPSNPRASKYEHVSEISVAMKQIAKDLKVPVIALAQLNRDIEKGNGREPQLSDLRDSGSIEQDADIVLMLHWETPEDEEIKQTKLLIRKHRSGRMGAVDLTFHRAVTRFESRKLEM